MRAAFLDWGSVTAGDLDDQCLRCLPVDWAFHENTGPSQLAERTRQCEVVVTNKVSLNANDLQQADKLGLICVAATGTNNIDLDAAARQDIAVCNVTGYATDSVVQHVFMLMLQLARQQPAYQAALQRGRWQQSEHFCFLDYRIESLANKTLGIVGYGELGQAVANMASQFGMDVLVAQRLHGTPLPNRVAFDELLSRVDVLSLHCPLTEQTRHLIAAPQLALMKPTAFVINTARGGIIHEPDLLHALQNGQIGGAALDVLEQEPPPEDSLLLKETLPNLIITPHIAWASRQARQKLIGGVAANITGWLQGKIINRVN